MQVGAPKRPFELFPAAVIARPEGRILHVENNPRSRIVNRAHCLRCEQGRFIKPHDLRTKLGHSPEQITVDPSDQRPGGMIELEPSRQAIGRSVGVNIECLYLLAEPLERFKTIAGRGKSGQRRYI
jgi:hypothetical protein